VPLRYVYNFFFERLFVTFAQLHTFPVHGYRVTFSYTILLNNMLSEYKLRCAIYGHENDVRALASLNFPQDSFVSASRDITSRVWVLKE
jgi:hypothetical protein